VGDFKDSIVILDKKRDAQTLWECVIGDVLFIILIPSVYDVHSYIIFHWSLLLSSAS
jgi:hypothetical protein